VLRNDSNCIALITVSDEPGKAPGAGPLAAQGLECQSVTERRFGEK
jgi:hypothetical protein